MDRRHFVRASVGAAVGLPFVFSHQEMAAQQAADADPVLAEIAAEFKEQQREWEERPNDRRATMRATEATLGVLAAHLGQQYDAQMRRDLRRQVGRRGRAVLVNDLAQRLNRAHAEVDGAIRIFDQRGPAAAFRDAQRALRQVRLNTTTGPVAHVALRQPGSWCQDVANSIQMVDWMTTLACSLIWLGPASVEACMVMGLALATLQASYWFFCS